MELGIRVEKLKYENRIRSCDPANYLRGCMTCVNPCYGASLMSCVGPVMTLMPDLYELLVCSVLDSDKSSVKKLERITDAYAASPLDKENTAWTSTVRRPTSAKAAHRVTWCCIQETFCQ
jgi:hypothetical protein